MEESQPPMRALIKIGGEETSREHHLKQRQVTEREKGCNQRERCEGCERERVEAAAEADIEDGAEQKRPEAGRDGDRGKACNRRFGDPAVAEQLRDGESNNAAVKSIGQVGETHEPYRNPRSIWHPAQLPRQAKLHQVSTAYRPAYVGERRSQAAALRVSSSRMSAVSRIALGAPWRAMMSIALPISSVVST